MTASLRFLSLFLFQCIPEITKCILDLDFGFSAMAFGNEVVDECDEESWLEAWYDNITTSFCPKMSRLIEKSQNASLYMNQLYDRSLPIIWNHFIICRVLASDKDSNYPKEKKKQKAWKVDTIWSAICIEVCMIT